MRRCRARKTAGIIRLDFEVFPEGAALFAELGWLDPAEQESPAAVRSAFEQFVNAAGAAGISPRGEDGGNRE
jgi:hypothetical protein